MNYWSSGTHMELLKQTLASVLSAQYPQLPAKERQLIESILIRKEYKKGEILLKEGEISHHIIFIGSGMVRQFYYKNGKDITEHFSYEGCLMMCIESLLKQEPTHLMAEALENSIIFQLPYEQLQKLMLRYREINRFYQKILEYALIVSQEKADSWRFETARERYHRLWKNHPEVIKRAPLSHIASYLLMTPETLSRVRSGIL